jgi:nicotinate-nucleotide--dimethylbenzimidazole phosphoribosyltransferase
MRLVLKGKGELELQMELPPAVTAPGEVALRVLCCGICRTDARMWREGHRDLVLPRVPGHEIAAVDPLTDQLYTVWPGEVCGSCPACLAGRENLCEKMRIIGFHRDGGLAAEVVVPRQCLIPVADGLDPLLVTFAEPVACLLNPLPRLAPVEGEHALVVGGGVLGMLAALVLREQGCRVTVIESSAAKRARQQPLAEAAGVALLGQTNRADFDLAITCCSAPAGFTGALEKLRKGGRLAFFSGLDQNRNVDDHQLNLIHYRELTVVGSYGPRRGDMAAALAFCQRNQRHLGQLIDRLLAPQEVAGVLPQILAGQALKYVMGTEFA